MHIRSFDWDNANINHIAKHEVSGQEVSEIFFSKVVYLKSRHGRYVAYGTTQAGRYLFVVFIKKPEETIRVITARDMVPKERQYYRKRR